MPIYEYICQSCNRKSSFLLRSINDTPDPFCKSCGSRDVTKAVSAFFHHKGVLGDIYPDRPIPEKVLDKWESGEMYPPFGEEDTGEGYPPGYPYYDPRIDDVPAKFEPPPPAPTPPHIQKQIDEAMDRAKKAFPDMAHELEQGASAAEADSSES